MLNLYKNFFIHYSVLILLGCIALKGSFDTFGLVVISVTAHECGHLLAMLLCREKAEKLILHAFGISINAGISSLPCRKILFISLGGPLFSILLSVIFYFVFPPLFLPNLCLGLVNIIPALPLDGGRVLHALLEKICGRKSSRIIMHSIGITLGIITVPVGFALLLTTGYNFSLLMLGAFVTADCFAEPFCEPTSFVVEKPVLGELYIIPEDCTLRDTADFLPNNAVGVVLNQTGKVVKLVTAKGLLYEMAEN